MPAPDSMKTSNPARVSFFMLEGTMPTRVSPSGSFGTPSFIRSPADSTTERVGANRPHEGGF